jgi:hypothetical protein
LAAIRGWSKPLFPPDPPPSTEHRIRRFLLYAGAGAVLMTVFVLRVSESIPGWQSLWSEDGAIFFSQAVAHPLVTNLFTPYSGYLHFAPRLLAQADSLFPVRDTAALYVLEGSAAATGCALLVYRSTQTLIASRGLRALLAASLITLPAARYELIATLVNIQWFLTATLLWLLLWRPSTAAGRIVVCGVAFLAAASQPLVAIFLPVVILRLFAVPWRENGLVVAYAAGLACQAWALLTHAVPSSASLGYVHVGAHVVAKLFALRVGVGTLAGTRPTVNFWLDHGPKAVAAVTVLILVAAALALRSAPRRVQIWAATSIGVAAVLFAYTTHSRYVTISLAPGQDPLEWNARYTFVPSILLLAVLAMAASNVLARARPALRVGAVAAIAVALGFAWASGFQSTRGTGPEWTAVLAAARPHCQPGASIAVTITPPPWKAVVPCSMLGVGRR